ncbi:hypothetical protein JCM10213_005880 [Rhodosporidiobolus nylandii]
MSSSHPHPPAAASAVPARQFSLEDARAVYALAEEDSRLGRKVKEALEITDRALDEYGLEQVALSFNGGKDCTVLIHLLCASFLHHLSPSSFSPSLSSPSPSSSSSSAPRLPPIPTIYIRTPSPFPQVEAFVSLCVEWYNLDLEAREGGMKEVLQGYLDARPAQSEGEGERKGGSRVKAVFVGVRRNDPHGATLTPLCPTDPSWPAFMRVHPILDWSYSDVWAFLRSPALTLGAGAGGDAATEGSQGKGREKERRGLEWCELYDYGYTSLGSTHNTFPNPLLRATTSDGHYDAPNGHTAAPLGGWRPAWELLDEGAERAGRETSLNAVIARTPSPSAAKREQNASSAATKPAAGTDSGRASEMGRRADEGEVA